MTVASVPSQVEPILMACWYQPLVVGTTQALIDLGTSGGQNNRRTLNIGSNGLRFEATSRTTAQSSASSPTDPRFAAEKIMHGAAFFESSTSRYAFAQGVVGAQEATSRVPTAPNMTTIGRLGNASAYANGIITWPAIWKCTTLTEAQDIVSRMYAGEYPLNINRENLLAFWDFTGSDTIEYSFDGTLGLVNTAGSVPVRGPDFLYRRIPRRWFPRHTAASTYTGTSALTTRGATLSSSATFTKPTYTGSSVLNIGATVLSGSATFAKPTYTGSSTLLVGTILLSGSATFTKPAYTGSSVLNVGAAILSASGTFTKPTYTGSSTLLVGAVLLSGSATFTKPTYTGSSSLIVGAAVLSASGTFTKPVYAASSALTLGRTVLAGTGLFNTAQFLATSVLTTGKVLLNGSATFVAKFTGTGSFVIGPVSLNGTATFTKPVYTASSSLVVGAVFLNGTATFKPQFIATANLVIGPTILSGSGVFILVTVFPVEFISVFSAYLVVPETVGHIELPETSGYVRPQ